MENGRPLDPSYVARTFSSSAGGWWRAAPLTFRAPRHSAVSLMLASGADIAGVSKLMGRASIAITADVYSHLVDTIAQKPWTVPRTRLHTQCTHIRGWTPDAGFVLKRERDSN